jgi:hypothetical protein
MIDVVFKYSNETAFHNRLVALGLSVRTGQDENGHDYRVEELMGLCSTPVLEDTSGDKYLCSRMTQEDADKFPGNDHNPAFTIIWRSDDLDEDGNKADWPEVTITAYDIDGNPSGTTTQGVGRIV